MNMLKAGRAHATREQALLFMTDGDPADMPEAEEAAAELKRLDITVIFVQIGNMVNPENIRRLASEPLEKNIIKLESYDELVSGASKVLKSVLKVSLWVKRVKC